MRFLLISLFLLFTGAQKVRAQEMTELEKALMSNSDSTLILSASLYGGTWLKNAFIVSKKDSLVSCYLYHFYIYDLPVHQYIPKGMAGYLKGKETFNRYGNEIEANRFFSILKPRKGEEVKLWQRVSGIKPWEMGDDSTYGMGCPIEVKRVVNGDTITTTVPSLGQMDSGDPYILKLITKDGMKTLSYNLPEASERVCPGKKGRQQFIKLLGVILKYYGKDSACYQK